MTHRPILTSLVLLSLAAGFTRADEPVPPALIEVRQHMLDASVNSLTFHNMDQIFDTRRVANGTMTWPLASDPKPLEFSYTHNGTTYTAQEGLERTFTNALIVLKGGKIVSEIYRNKTDASTHFISFSMAK